MKDPIVEEVRRHRAQHTREHSADLAAICKDLRSLQRASGHKIVRLPPGKVRPARGSPARG
jgi:hypothetical protein